MAGKQVHDIYDSFHTNYNYLVYVNKIELPVKFKPYTRNLNKADYYAYIFFLISLYGITCTSSTFYIKIQT